RGSKRGARARLGIDPRRPESAGLSISDLLLLKDGEAKPATLDEAIAHARGDVRVRPEERLGLFWEVYGLGNDSDTLTFAVSLTRTGVGALRRAAERLGVSAGMTPVRVRWREQPGAAAILPRATVVALPNVPPGEYLLEVTARTSAGEVTATRRIRVER
ncbi:MAG TPA: hypothetical protein VFQ39_03665, partial [Longimicrobium sp.]|nr:hypothetical protein [Longimicrobium sp.]